jgi:hypothetical protein
MVIFPFSRMFLALPLLLGIAFSFCSDLVKRKSTVCACLLAAGIVLFAVKASTLGNDVAREASSVLPGVVLRRIDASRELCVKINALCAGKVGLIVALRQANCTPAEAPFYCLAGEMLVPDYPKTLIYGFERQSWRTEAEATNVNSYILFIGGTRRGWQTVANPNITDFSDDKTVIHLVHNVESLPLPGVLRKLKPVTQ